MITALLKRVTSSDSSSFDELLANVWSQENEWINGSQVCKTMEKLETVVPIYLQRRVSTTPFWIELEPLFRASRGQDYSSMRGGGLCVYVIDAWCISQI